MDATNSFEKGINQDSFLVPKGSYVTAKNAIVSDQKLGQFLSLSNEEGFSIQNILFDGGSSSDYYIVGHCICNDDVAIFSCLLDSSGSTIASEVGYLTTNALTNGPISYQTVYNDKNGIFNFNINAQIDAEFRTDFQGHKLVYWTDGLNKPRKIDIDQFLSNPPPLQAIDEDTSLFPEFSLPIVSLNVDPSNPNSNGQGSGGQLYAGIYQFAVRYLTSTLNETTFGPLCNPIPVTPFSQAVGRNGYTGANWDSPFINKNINLVISNIDTNYPYIELVAVWYTGAANNAQIQVVDRIAVNNQATINYTFTGTSFLATGTPITLGSLSQVTASYATAKHIIQKDGRLFLSNLSNPVDPDFTKVVSKFRVGYYVEEIEYPKFSNNVFNDYKNEANTFNNKGFQRDEVYSLAISFIFSDGRISFAYSIPGNDRVHSYNSAGTNDYPDPGWFVPGAAPLPPSQSGLVGTYISSDTYGYDALDNGNINDNIRHHLMPSIENCPHVVAYLDTVPHTDYNYVPGTDPRVNKTYIRILKLNIPNFQAVITDPAYSDLFKDVRGFILLRQERNTQQNTRIVCQGCVNRLILNDGVRACIGTGALPNTYSGFGYVAFGVNYTIDPDHGHNEDLQDVINPTFQISPLFGGTLLYGTYQGPGTVSGGSYYNRGRWVNRLDGIYEETDPAHAFSKSHLQAFYSPDIILGNTAIPASSKIKPVFSFLGEFNQTKGDLNFATSQSDNTAFRWHVFSDMGAPSSQAQLTTIWSGPIQKGQYSGDYINIDSVQYLANQNAPIADDSGIASAIVVGSQEPNSSKYNRNIYQIINPLNEGYTLLTLSEGLPTQYQVDGNSFDSKFSLEADAYSTFDAYLLQNTIVNYNNGPFSNWASPQTGAYPMRLVYNIFFVQPNQYGNVGNATYVPTDVYPSISSPANFTEGDVFISQFSFRSSSTIRYTLAKGGGTISTGTGCPLVIKFNGLAGDYVTVQNNDCDTANNNEGGIIRSLTNIFIESKINCNYRHRIIDRPTPYSDVGAQLGPDFYPNSSNPNDVMGICTSFQYAQNNGYNITYSFDNDVRTFVPKPFGFVQVEKLPTRTIYSQQSLQGEQTDQYRIFLINDLQDLPRDKGEITNQFVFNNTLYLHVENALWRTFVNTAVQIAASNVNAVLLGNGGVFDRPPELVFRQDGGYAGTQHKWGCANTPFGYVFPDFKNKKIFVFNDQLEEISAVGMTTWFNNNMNQPFNNPANPMVGGMDAHYDVLNKRYVLSINRGQSNGFDTLSFSFLTKSWVSFHDYSPSDSVSNGFLLFSFNNNRRGKLFRHWQGQYGQFYDPQIYPFLVTFQINNDFPISKVFDNLSVYAQFKDSLGNILPLDFFTTGLYQNSLQTSPTINYLVRPIGRDVQLNADNWFLYNVKRVNDEYRLKIGHAGVNYLDDVDWVRFKDKYLYITFSYNNQNKAILNYVESSIRRNYL
jgi:hypothetical protein